jgi:hypothetical protein
MKMPVAKPELLRDKVREWRQLEKKKLGRGVATRRFGADKYFFEDFIHL